MAGMATRTSAHEERLATLRSVMNVIAILDQTSSRRAVRNNGFDLRALMPFTWATAEEDSWDEFRAHVPAPRKRSGTGDLQS
jgi:hypothetical protein